jgi:hypothetical protein
MEIPPARPVDKTGSNGYMGVYTIPGPELNGFSLFCFHNLQLSSQKQRDELLTRVTIISHRQVNISVVKHGGAVEATSKKCCGLYFTLY